MFWRLQRINIFFGNFHQQFSQSRRDNKNCKKGTKSPSCSSPEDGIVAVSASSRPSPKTSACGSGIKSKQNSPGIFAHANKKKNDQLNVSKRAKASPLWSAAALFRCCFVCCFSRKTSLFMCYIGCFAIGETNEYVRMETSHDELF